MYIKTKHKPCCIDYLRLISIRAPIHIKGRRHKRCKKRLGLFANAGD